MHARRRLHPDDRTSAEPVALPARSGTGIRAAVLDLQRTAGNRAVTAWVAGTPAWPATARPVSSRAASAPPTVVQPSAGLQVQRDDDGAQQAGGRPSRGALFDGGGLVFGDPGEFFADKPSLVPRGGLAPLPADAVTGLIDWGDVGTAFADRRLVLQDRDRTVIVDHYRRWYPVARALYGLPLAARLFDSPAAIMNTMTGKMIDASLSGSNLNMVEQFDREAQRFGVSTTGASITLKRF